ncbi:hypothetical protein CY0110_16552 [Crocosphaera chwakensis CCY0110]|uniref:Uncharacterized protein n=1 Tax=Crocosphaera chwakensis CCY0110 TaxID=391612 RepID=A3IHZ2_9CHRO|nr:hypothetical protein CY0110_16552 [Crocosphaera chwakensis CCY0110]
MIPAAMSKADILTVHLVRILPPSKTTKTIIRVANPAPLRAKLFRRSSSAVWVSLIKVGMILTGPKVTKKIIKILRAPKTPRNCCNSLRFCFSQL